MTDIVSIPETERLYKDEWLLFEVLESGEQDEPLRGRLLFHHPDREVAFDKGAEYESLLVYVTYTGPVVPEGMEAVL